MLGSTTPGDLNGPPVALVPPTGPVAPVRGGHGMVWASAAVLIVAGAGGAWWLWQSHRAPQQAQAAPPAMTVPAITVVARTVPIYRSFPALTEAMRSVPIQARVTGYLLQQGAADGADVVQNDLLYRVDARDYQVALAQAAGQRNRSIASARSSG